MRFNRLLCLAGLFAMIASRGAAGQCVPQWLPEGDIEAKAIPGMFVKVVLPLADGDLLLGGIIPGSPGGTPWNNLVRYHPATHEFTPCHGGVTGSQGLLTLPFVRDLVMDASGEVYVGGNFTLAGGIASRHIARYNPTTGVWTALPDGPEGPIYSISLSRTGTVVVGGDFQTLPSGFVGPVAVYSPILNIWEGVGPGLAFHVLYVSHVAWSSTGDIYAYADGSRDFPPEGSAVHRYNPITGVWTRILGLGAENLGEPHSLLALPGGDVAICGPVGFGEPGGVQVYNHVTRAFTRLATPSAIYADNLALAPDGSLVAVGFGSGTSLVARYNFGSGAWTTLTSGVTQQLSAALGVTRTGDIVVSSSNLVDGMTSPNTLFRYNASQLAWEVPIGVKQAPTTMLVLPDGDVLVAGTLTEAGLVQVSNVARFHPADGSWSALGAGTNGSVRAILQLPGGDVLVGGSFTLAGGQAASRVARYNPSTNTWSSAGTGVGGVNSAINALALLPSGEVIAGGTFTAPGRRVARFNPATNAWTSMGSVGLTGPLGIGNTVNAITVNPAGDVYVGGLFSSVVGAGAANNIAHYRPSTGAWSALGAGTDGEVVALAIAPHTGALVVGGPFAVVDDTIQAFNVAIWSPATSSWSNAGQAPTSTVTALLPLENGDILATGSFRELLDQRIADGLAQLNPSTRQWSTEIGFEGVPFGSGSCLARGPLGDIYLGGTFTRLYRALYPGFTEPQTNNFAHLGCPSVPCAVDFNHDGDLNADDLGDFITCYFGSPPCPGAEFNHDGDLNADDLGDFITAYFAGCP